MTTPLLFPDAADAPAAVPTLFAEVVFDRPLDTAYTYAVPEHLSHSIGIGKRVECSFGKGVRNTAGYCIGITAQAPHYPTKPILSVLDDVALLDEPLLKLTRWMADYYLCGWGQVLQSVLPAGVREKAGTRNATLIEAIPKEEWPAVVPSVNAKQKKVLDFIETSGEVIEQNELAKACEVGLGVISTLVSKGLLRKSRERVERLPAGLMVEPAEKRDSPHVLNNEQRAVWAPIEEAIKTGGFHPFLLHGVTGSGKTEVYLRAIEEVIRQGKEAIVLVPEISLTPQTIERFRGRCGSVAVLHSHLSDAERAGYWRHVAAGHVQVVVGARSAVFAPTRKLGLIVIDEEHETSFKQESTPRYHARDVAIMRAHLQGVPIILGSATPALESWHAATTGKYKLLSMTNRVASRPMPHVKLVDLRVEMKAPGKRFAIGPTLEQGMKDALAAGGQVILLLNRRGFSTHVHCPACGHVAQCQHCDLGLTFHRQKAALVCHYCGWETAPQMTCSKCGESSIRYQGMGTEKLQAEIEERFPGKVIQRMDSDTMGRSGSHERAFDAFREGRIDILLGTQMIAKGLDFPNVTLVGVVNADVGLHLPDFRAAERTFQLLAQVAGRTGRSEKGGSVLVQTYTPEHPCIMLAAKHDYLTFARQELAFRKEHAYPPYQRMARLIVRSEDAKAAETFAEHLAGSFKAAGQRANAAKVRVLGPAECPVFKLHDHFRYHFQVQSEHSAHLHGLLREVLAVSKPPSGVEFVVDVDPYNML